MQNQSHTGNEGNVGYLRVAFGHCCDVVMKRCHLRLQDVGDRIHDVAMVWIAVVWIAVVDWLWCGLAGVCIGCGVHWLWCPLDTGESLKIIGSYSRGTMIPTEGIRHQATLL